MTKFLFAFVSLTVVFVVGYNRAAAQTYTGAALYSFCSQTNCEDRDDPPGNLIQAADGNFYGVAEMGGSEACSYCGAIFEISPAGTYSVVHSFLAGGLYNPVGALVQGSDGNFYGTASASGTSVLGLSGGVGGVFRMTPSGALTVLHTFCSQANSYGRCADGQEPYTALIQGTDGNFYGTTIGGGANDSSTTQGGTVFSITPAGVLTVLHSFCPTSACLDGLIPGALVQATDGYFYGTTEGGGANGNGSVFKINPSGTDFQTVYSFCSLANCADGSEPNRSLTAGPNGSLYGTTSDGFVFAFRPGGTETTIADTATSGVANALPSSLFTGSGGLLYGVTTRGGASTTACEGSSCGYVFQVTPGGVVTDLADDPCGANQCAEDAYPTTPLQASDGNLYLPTFNGGASGDGQIYKVTATPALQAPVRLTLSSAQIALGQSVTLTWTAANAFSETMQQCFAFVPSGNAGAGNWSGLQQGTISGTAYSGSATVAPTADGVYTYAITCGGVESAQAVLHAGTGGRAASRVVAGAASPLVVGSLVPLSADVYAIPSTGPVPAGSVSFYYGSISLGTISLSSTGTAELALQSTTLTPGSYTITASYSGDDTYAASSAAFTVVLQPYATVPVVTVSPNPLTEGQKATLGCNVSRYEGSGSPSGTVTWITQGITLATATLQAGSASAVIPTSASLPPGTYPVICSYAGDTDDGAFHSQPVSVTVLSPKITTLSVTPTQVGPLQNATFSVTVRRAGAAGVPAGTVDIYDGTTLLTIITLSNGAGSETVNNNSFGLPSGTFSVVAEYQGDTDDNTSNSAPVSITVEPPGNATSIDVSGTATSAVQGQPLTLKAGISRQAVSGEVSGGSVSFYTGTTLIATAPVTGPFVNLTITVPSTTPAGVYPLVGKYSGDSTDQPSTSPSVTVTIIAPTTTAIAVTPQPAPANSAISFAVSIEEAAGSPAATGSVSCTFDGSTLGPQSLNASGQATLSVTDFGIAAGNYPVTCQYSGDALHETSSGSVTVQVR